MKKQIFLPVLAVMLAVGGAFAANKFAPVYFEGGDSTCTISVLDPQCPPGEANPCIDSSNGLQYYYKTDVTATECLQLFRD